MANDVHRAPMVLSDAVSLPHRSGVLAFLEGLTLLGVVAALDHFGVAPYQMWPVHPLMLIVILLSAQYGIEGGVLAALGAIAITHIDGVPVRPVDVTYSEHFRAVWGDSLSWLIAALTVGVVTSHRSRMLKEQADKLRKVMRAEALIAAQYDVLAKRTHMLEQTLAEHADGTVAIDGAGPKRPVAESEVHRPRNRKRSPSTPSSSASRHVVQAPGH